MKKLIIAEKPSLAKTIVRGIRGNDNFKDYFENENYIVTSQFGHLLELYSIGDYKNDKERDKKWTLDDLPYLPKEYKYKVKDDLGIKARYKLIKELIKKGEIDRGKVTNRDVESFGTPIYEPDIFSYEEFNKYIKEMKGE